MQQALRRIANVLQGLTLLAYPGLVYLALLRSSARLVGGVLCVVWLGYGLRAAQKAPRAQLWGAIRGPLLVFALAGGALLSNDRRFVLAVPVFINLGLLWTFALSLRSTPLVERFARLQKGALSSEEQVYCRSVTRVWCVFFAGNGLVCAVLALSGRVALWTAYTGFVSYLLIGIVGGTEYVVRKARFREYGPGLHDRLLRRVFPPPVPRPADLLAVSSSGPELAGPGALAQAPSEVRS